MTSSTTIINSIQPLVELVTVNAQLAKAALHVSITQGVLNACSFMTSYVAQGSIDAGIDFMAIGAEDIAYDEASKTYTITLPAPRVLGCSIDYIDQYSSSTTLCAVVLSDFLPRSREATGLFSCLEGGDGRRVDCMGWR